MSRGQVTCRCRAPATVRPQPRPLSARRRHQHHRRRAGRVDLRSARAACPRGEGRAVAGTGPAPDAPRVSARAAARSACAEASWITQSGPSLPPTDAWVHRTRGTRTRPIVVPCRR